MIPAQKGKWFQCGKSSICFKYAQINHVQEGRECILRKQGNSSIYQ